MNRKPKLREVMESVSKTFFSRTLSKSLKEGICVVCGKEKGRFRDKESEREYSISGLCQACQDITLDVL